MEKEADEIKLKIEEKKLASGEQMPEVCAWSDGIDKVVEGVDAEIEHLLKCLGEAKQKSRTAEKEDWAPWGACGGIDTIWMDNHVARERN